MGRPKQFDREQVLRQAMEIFWAQGFAATTMSALVRGLGIGRQSLYDTFGDREQLYRACLDEYRRYREADIARLRATTGPLCPILRRHFDDAIEEACGEQARHSCLMLNAAIERGNDEGIRTLVAEHFRAIEDLLTDRLRKAQAAGEVGASQPPRALARFLLNTLNGMRVTGRFAPSRRHLRQIVDAALAVLDPHPAVGAVSTQAATP